jgi:hypothetical protein
MGLGTLRLRPCVIDKSVTVDRIAVQVATAGANNDLRLGIYVADSTGLPSTLRLDAGTVSAATTGVKEITISETLAAGVYWLAVVAQNTGGCQIAGYNTVAPILPATINATFGGNNTYLSLSKLNVTGALPNPLGALDLTGNVGPLIQLRRS